MRKKEILFGILFVFFLIGINFTSAVLPGETEAVEAGYDCLRNTIDVKSCDSLSLEEQIFSLLSVGKCKDQILAEAEVGNTCWPKTNCDLRTTALATLAFEKLNLNVTNSKNWMLAQKGVPTNIDWFLEIDSSEAADCEISFDSSVTTAHLNEDKTVTILENDCLTIDQEFGGYWFEIAKECYDYEFAISCDQDFLTTLLFKKPGLSTLYILSEVNSALAQGTTLEKIDSSCFRLGADCDYEGSLWSSMILDILGEDMGSIIPYLITGKTENSQFLPSSFLYYLTNTLEFRTNLLSGQIAGQYWNVGRSKYYDTAIALLALQGENPQEKDNSKQWLMDVQEDSGCWNVDNVRDTALILYSVWPEIQASTPNPTCTELGYTCVENATACDGTILGYECAIGECCDDGTQAELSCIEAGYDCVENASMCDGTVMENNCSTGICCNDESITLPGGDDDYCEENGYYCMTSLSCSDAGGSFLSTYECPGVILECCDTPETVTTCSDLFGEVCDFGEDCIGGESRDTDKLYYGETCCVGGTCEESTVDPEEEYTCELIGGVCEISSCDEGYSEEYGETCKYEGDICCIEDYNNTTDGKSYWWVWVLFVLVILVTLAILYKDKLQEFLLNMRNKGGKKSSGNNSSPRFPPSYPRRPMNGIPNQRKILPPQQNVPINRNIGGPRTGQIRKPIARKPVPQKSPRELGEVLKKLKDMSK